MKSAKNTVLLKDEREEMDLSVVAHELLLFVEKISLHLHRMRVQFEMSKGNKSAKKAIEEYLKFKTPDDKEFELSYDGPTGHGVLQKAVGCKPFFEKLGISKSDMERLYKYSQALESQLTSRNGQEDGPDVKNHSNDQERNTVVDLLNGMLSKLTLAAENPEHFYISCVAKVSRMWRGPAA